ncbi:TMEM220 protein [Trema orientale]|uniref:TMEM220 protein n=1 Tax=Trema orientale TaxID=63057 RepID=A0A2P5FXV6_TREOI|nr:TMEM220 protein [Trema orientale]
MARPTKLYSFSSLAMAALFAYSASVQLDDHDWYFWLPLYSGACIVSLLNWVISSKPIKHLGEAALWLGILLFIKVVIEDIRNGISGLRSMDLSERVVREKIGSGLVVISMILQLIASQSREFSTKGQRSKFPRYVEYGMALLVGFSYGLPLVFFVIQKGEMRFDQTE